VAAAVGQATKATAIFTDAQRRALVRFLSRRLGDPSDIEDIVQEAMLRVVRATAVQAALNPEAFLFHVAGNLIRDRARRRRTLQAMLENSSQLSETVEGRSPERVLQARQTLGLVVEALAKLDEPARDAFVLHRLEGLSHAEIADRFGVSVSSVEKYVMRAIAAIARQRQRLGEE
jgi:RNA polymerase sigma factor (sigma-70 family)